MATLIIPCGGKSSRFPGLKPKWMLTHPDGMLMIQKSISGLLKQNSYERIVVTFLEQHIANFDALNILEQALADLRPKVEFCVLPSPTKSQSETVYQTILKMNIQGEFVVKDSDNYVEVKLDCFHRNFIGSVNLLQNHDVSNVASKSFVIANDQNIIQSIVEKEVVSNDICVGVYGFSDVNLFKQAYLMLTKFLTSGELYVSHIVAQLINEGQIFQKLEVHNYKDWGTLNEWRKEQEKFKTIFVDFDGVLIKNSGKYGKLNWDNNSQLNKKNCELLQKLQQQGAQIIITTARPWSYEGIVRSLLSEVGIIPYSILMGLNQSQRVIINDFANTNPYPSCIAISIPRDGNLTDYLS